MSAPLSRREQNRREVRDRLYGAAISLFTEQGFEATSMDAIAERAGVARATAFNHFGQKASFLQEWGTRRRAHVARSMAANAPVDAPVASQLGRYLGELAALNLASRQQTAILMEASWRFGGLLRDPAPESVLLSLIESGIGRGEIRSDADPTRVAHLLWVGYLSTVLRWIEAEPPFGLREELESLLDVVLRGVLR